MIFVIIGECSLAFAFAVCLLALVDSVRARNPRPVATDITAQPFPDITRPEMYQRDEGDENLDIATEGLGLWDPWPGFAAIAAVRAANPKLTDVHAYAVAKARKRLAAHR